MTPEEEENEQPPFPLGSLTQQVFNKAFLLGRKRIGANMFKILSFNRGLTLILPEDAENHPHTDGQCDIFVHRRFLNQYEKFLHWIIFVFKNPNNQISIPAQIMLSTRVGAGCEITKDGGAACFLNNPFPQRRRTSRRFQGRRINYEGNANTRIRH